MLPPSPGSTKAFSRALIALTLLTELGCEDTVALGSECASFAQACEDERGAANGGNNDASTGDGVTGDGDEPGTVGDPPETSDAGADSSVPDAGDPDAPNLTIANGSFEALEPDDDVIPFADAAITDWEWCEGDVSVSDSFYGHDASDGQSLVSLSFGLLGFPVLSQRLAEKLVVGESYTLAVDASRSDDGPDELRLRVYGGSEACAETTALAVSEAVEEANELRTYCLSFTPEQAFEYLVLAVDPLSLDGELYIDNLRVDPACKP